MFYLAFYTNASGVACMRKVIHGPDIAPRDMGLELRALCKSRTEPTWDAFCSEGVMDRVVQRFCREEQRRQEPTVSYRGLPIPEAG